MVLSRRSRGRLGGLRRPRPELRGQDAEAPEGGSLAAAARALRGVPVHHRSQQMSSEGTRNPDQNEPGNFFLRVFERKIAGGLIAGCR